MAWTGGSTAEPRGERSGLLRKWSKYLIICIFVLFAGIACERPAGPDLLTIRRVGPGLVEGGNELQIHGGAFPDGRAVQVALQGILYAPGREPRAVSSLLAGVSRSAALVVVPLGSRRLEELTGGAGHGTFRGRVRVRFEPQLSGAPPLVGESGRVVLDFLPRTGGEPELAARFGAFLGLALDDRLVVTGLEPGAEAEQAGLRLGDHLLELDGVRLVSRSEFVPAPRGLQSRLVFRREGFADPVEVPVNRQSFLALDASVTRGALLGVAALCLALLLVARPPRALVWMFRPRRRGSRASSVSSPAPILVMCLVLAAMWGILRLSLPLDFELVVLCSAGALPLLLASFLAGGRRARGAASFSLVGAFAGALMGAVYLVPIFGAVAVCSAEVGSLRLADFVRDQELLPTTWLLARSPWLALLGVFFLVALVPRAGRRAPCEGARAEMGSASVTVDVLEQIGVLWFLALWVVLFAGGPAGAVIASWRAGVLLGLKLAVLWFSLGMARERLGDLRRGESWSLLGPGIVLGSLVLSAVGLSAARLPAVQAASDRLSGFAIWLVLAVVVLLPIVGLRSLSHQGRRADPWI